MHSRALVRSVATLAFSGAVAFVAAPSAAAPLGPQNPTFDADPASLNWFSSGGTTSDPSFAFIEESGGAIDGTGRGVVGASSTSADADLRSEVFSVSEVGSEESLTFDFQYQFTEAVAPDEDFRVGLRFWEDENGTMFTGESNSYIGSTSGDTSDIGSWQSFSADGISVPDGAVTADIRISANIFGDDTWSSGATYFDDFSVVVPEPSSMVAALIGGGALLMRSGRSRRA
jgi:hypothetical protein